MNLSVKKAKMRELLNSGIITQTEYKKIINLLTDLADTNVDDETTEKFKDIYRACKKNTTKQLIMPDSAVYPSFSEDMIEYLDPNSYLISFYVDSENKKGAALRTNIRCKIVNGKYEGTSFLLKKAKPKFGGTKITEEWSNFNKPKK